MQLRDTQQKNKDLDDELCWQKNLWESTISESTDKLNKAEEELRKAKERLKQLEAGL